ncbi:Protein of unknown function [Desulfonispora thiosulfatigenes DSM 11270]|uniref:DUF1064 domain-containing protein n=1 Tax=Desulfonispora thiosulfatigenes DSM 11270 TaxID=656914 RepID=A0A1W1VQ37_DESTI|nr:DUF1064 domain-containing protein [Desulfonispora thiosulfatigenes]SMB95469.1 Protein of unknown function [Desulfonispora thiosulfatigenes DSM 11270]
MTRISREMAEQLGIVKTKKSKSKYGSRKKEIDGITFDSVKEARKYSELKLLKRAGEIKDFELQPEFELQPGYRNKDGKKIRPITYRADFKVIYPNDKIEYIDTKGFRTKEYLLKKKMLLFKYPDINFVEE